MNLILVATVSEGLFKTRRYLKRCPLDSILCSADVPQAIAARVNSTPVLRVAFSEETVTVSFTEGGKRLADRWAESVRRAAAGNIDVIDTSELPSGTAAEIADFVDGAVGVVGAVGDSIGSALGASLKAQKPHAEKMAVKATAKCPGCHAPVAGRKGQGVVCSYCDTKFVLEGEVAVGIVNVAIDSLGGVLADQWKDIVTAGHFDEHVVVAPGVRKVGQNGRGGNYGSNDVLSNGSLIFVPENTAAFIFSQAGIEQIITEPGGFEYRDGEASVFDDRDREEQGVLKMVLGQAARRVGYAGMSPSQKRVAFVNLREIRGIKFGTRGPLAYNDLFYGADLEVFAYGQLSLQVVDAERFIRNFLPANTYNYSLDDPHARSMLIAEFLASLIVTTNALSSEVRISQLPSRVNEIRHMILDEGDNAGTWQDRFGIKLVQVAIENIEFSDDSRELIKSYAKKKLDVSAYEGVSKQTADVAAQQMIAEGVRENGFGAAGGMVLGMGLAGMLNPRNASVEGGAGAVCAPDTTEPKGAPGDSAEPARTLEDQIEAVKKFKELLDAGILTQEEFDAKKREILGL